MKCFYTFVICFLILCSFSLEAQGGKTIEQIEAERKKESPKTKKTAEKEHEEKKVSDKEISDKKETPEKMSAISSVPPFDETKGKKIDILSVDPELISYYNEAVKIEKRNDILQHPDYAIVAWKKIVDVSQDNPYRPIAKDRLDLWLSYNMYLEQRIESGRKARENIIKMMAVPSISVEQKREALLRYTKEYGVLSGVTEIMRVVSESLAPDKAKEITDNPQMNDALKSALSQRCRKRIGEDCHVYGMFFAADTEERKKYLKVSCNLNFKPACVQIERIVKRETELKRKKEAEIKEKERLRKIEAERTAKEKAEQERLRKIEADKKAKEKAEKRALRSKINKELWAAGRNKRVIWGGTSLLTGIGLGITGGIMFKKYSESADSADKYYELYLGAVSELEASSYRKKVDRYDKSKKAYATIGGISMGLSAALITTGIVLFSMETDSEKEVKKKYSWSIQANPFNGTVGLTIVY